MSKLKCRKCGEESGFADANIADNLRTCGGENVKKHTAVGRVMDGTEHDWKRQNEFGQIVGDAARQKDADLWMTHELRCTECKFIFGVAYGAKAKGLRQFGGVVDTCPQCEKLQPCIKSKYWDVEEMRNDKFNNE